MSIKRYESVQDLLALLESLGLKSIWTGDHDHEIVGAFIRRIDVLNMYIDNGYKHTVKLLDVLGYLNINSVWDTDLDQELVYPFAERMYLCLLIKAT
jgi:hypothetical protein